METNGSKNVLVTGGNRGLGEETARQLLALGHQVFITTRNPAEGEAARTRLLAAVPQGRLEVIPLDLASLDSVRHAARALLDRHIPLHVLIANAGYYNTENVRHETADGFEMHFGTNHLGHFLLTVLLQDALVAGAPSRVVMLSSGLHKGMMGQKPAAVDFDNLDLRRGTFSGVGAYSISKLCNVLFARELTRRWSARGVTANAVSPRMVPTTVARHTSGFQKFLMERVFPHLPMSRTPQQAAANTVFAALDPSLEGKGGLYLEDQKEAQPSAAALDDATARRLWDVSETLVGLAPRPQPQAAHA